MYIDRRETIDRYIKEHQKFKKALSSLSKEQILKNKVSGDWNIKDLVAHLAAWNLEAIDEVYRVLKNQATWPTRYEDEIGTDRFNREAVEKRKDKTWGKVLKEWDDSFRTQIELMMKLTKEEWSHQCNQTWKDKTPVTVYSLFAYEYEGEGHKGGHAKQISRFLNLS